MLSKLAAGICAIVMLCASFIFYLRWQKPATEATLSWDVSDYYWYLPSIFIYHDLKKQSFKDTILSKYSPTSGADFQQGFLLPNGNYVLKYSSGTALMYLPFFFAAHTLAKPLGFPADGFSPPYQFAIQFGGVLIALLGLLYLRKFLLLFYPDKIVAISLLLLAVGTNFLNYSTIDAGMSHCWLFTVYVFILLFTYRFYQAPSVKYAIAIGMLCGLATLSRPTDVISILIPLLWGLDSLSAAAIRRHFSFLQANARLITVSIICAAAVCSIQLIYWKYTAGEWLVYSYANQGFNWLHPHFRKYLIGAHNGWLTYSPVMLFSFVGLIPFWQRKKHIIAVTLFILVDLYIVCSWEFYWYGGRFMVQAYPVLAMPLASLVAWAMRTKTGKVFFAAVATAFSYIGLWTTIQYHYGGLYDWDTANRKYCLATIGRWHVPEDVQKLRDNNEIFEGTPLQTETIYANNFETDTLLYMVPALRGKKCIGLVQPQDERTFIFNYSSHSKEWIRAEATFSCKNKEWDVWKMSQLVVTFLLHGQEVKSNMIRIHRFLDNGDTRQIYLDSKIPSEDFDQVKIRFLHSNSHQPLFITGLHVLDFDAR